MTRVSPETSECETDRDDSIDQNKMATFPAIITGLPAIYFLGMCQIVHSQTKTLDKFTTETLILSCNCGLDRFGVLYQ